MRSYPHDLTRENSNQDILNLSVEPAGFLLAGQRDEIMLVPDKVRLRLHKWFVVSEPGRETGDVARTRSFEGDVGLYPAHQLIWTNPNFQSWKGRQRMLLRELTVFFELVADLPHQHLT